MTIELTAEEKIAIINQHVKALAYEEYNAILSLSQAQSVSIPNQDNIESLNNQILDISSQKSILQIELKSLSE